MPRDDILREFELFSIGTEGIGGWISKDTDTEVFLRLDTIGKDPLTKVQFNQLLAFGHEAQLSDDCFRYYWLSVPRDHPWDVSRVEGYRPEWNNSTAIGSLAQLKWGLYRLYADSMLYFGDVRGGYRKLRALNADEFTRFFGQRRFDTEAIRKRGPALPLRPIPRDDRYLISEMACKSYGYVPSSASELREALVESWRRHESQGDGPITVRRLLEGDVVRNQYAGRQQEFIFSADDVLDEVINSAKELEKKYGAIAEKFTEARKAALMNTNYYLSMVEDLDVYVATSMRSRQDFRDMANICDEVFADDRLKQLQIRYFDPTLSAADGHEDKGIIECLMVKCAKVLVYCAGEKESYGKDAEAAMALSLGKPVIFLCDQEQRSRFYKEVHPLSRLIEFESGVAVGAMVTDSRKDVSELLHRIFENKMEYVLERPREGYLRLKEQLTDSVVRLQTANRMLAETFWNHYHNREAASILR